MTQDRDRRSAIDHLANLVAFDTVSRNSNLALIDHVEAYLHGFAIPTVRIPDATGQKANLLAVIGPRERPGYILSGHTDVVPVDGQDWSSDPFTLRRENGRVYGRGTTDMKGFLACCLARVPDMVAADLETPLMLAFSYDEEVGCKGVTGLIDRLPSWAPAPIACFVGEPTGMQVVVGHKGKRAMRVVVTGRSRHSSLAPQAVNATEYAAEVAVRLKQIGRRLESQGPRDPLYDVPFTTAHVGRISGGAALNIVPDRCELDFEFRALPQDDLDGLVGEIEAFAQETLLPEMRGVAAEADIVFDPLAAFPALETPDDDPAVTLAKRLVGRNDHAKVAYGTEGGQFSVRGGIPTVVVGPGQIVQAHTPDEYIEVSELDRCEAFIGRLIDHAATAGRTA